MREPLWFREVSIRRMPGFPAGGPGLAGLSPGINLVRGLNASGKTTTARALQGLLWRGAIADSAAVEGRFELDGDTWLVEVDGTRIRWQRGGREASPPPLPPADARSRYLLSLHELLRADDRELAERIRVEMHAGYDVRAAAEALGLGAGGRKRSLVDALEEARTRRKEIEDEAARLRRQRAGLDERRRRLAECEEAARAARALERAVELAGHREKEGEARRRVEALPGILGSLRGDEVERLDRWSTREAAERTERDAARETERRARAALEEAGLGDDPPDRALRRELEERLDAVRRAEAESEEARDAMAEARARRERLDRALGLDHAGAGADGGGPTELPAELPDRLDAFLRDAGTLREKRAEVEARLREVEPGADGDSASPHGPGAEGVEEALHLLREWLRTPAPAEEPGGARRDIVLLLVAVVVLLLVGAAALVLAMDPDPWSAPLMGAGALAIGTAVALVAALVLGSRRAPAASRGPLEEKVARLDHAPPEWTVPAVRERVADLERVVAEVREAEARKKERRRLQARLETLEEEASRLEATREELAAELGVAPAPGELSLHALGTRLAARERAAEAEVAARARLASARRRRDDALDRAREIVEPFGYDPVDGESLSGARSELEARCQAHTDARRDLESAREKEAKAEEALEEIDGDRTEMLEGLGLSGEEGERELRRLSGRLEAYREARSALDAAHEVAETARGALEDMARGGDATAAGLLDGGLPPADELERRLGDARDADQKARELRDEITRIEERLRQARDEHDLEEAVAREDAARAELAEQRARDVEDEVGAVLARWARSSSARQNHPAVFERARELLVEITRGRYELLMSDDDPPLFRAMDRTSGHGRALDELSAGTRLQLLLAVRMAFVETREAGAAPPLLLDEVLANSDAHRADAIIDACITLARGGRQIFYFTAQPDELAKWREALEGSEVPWVETGLGGPAAGDGGIDWAARPVAREEIPTPGGRTMEEYGRILDVPPFDPWSEGVEGLHLWYLLDDPGTLYELLREGVRSWGQLDAFVSAAGAGAPEAVKRGAETARGRAALARRFAGLRRRGRGAPVDRAVLVASEAVSDTFIDEVTDLAREVGGRGAELLEALEAGRVARFRSRMIDKLRSHLLDEDHLSEEEPLDDEEILLELTAHAHRLETGLDARAVHALVERLVRGPRAPTPAGEAAP